MARNPRPGSELRKLQPKLRMIRNGSTTVNVLRAEHSSGLAAGREAVVRDIPLARGEDARPVERERVKARRGRLARESDQVYASVFVDVVDPAAARAIPGYTNHQGNQVTARVPLSELEDLIRRPEVSGVELGEPLKAPDPEPGPRARRAPALRLRRVAGTRRHRNGEGVLVGLVDVGGFDFAHPDFLDARGRTRFAAIWDQRGSARPSPTRRLPFNYGAELTAEHLDRALRGARELGLPATEIERQSQRAPGSHATHVASIAAGNRGVCRNAHIAGVLISLPDAHQDRRLSFYDSTRIADAIAYLFGKAGELGCQAVSVNVSLGTNGHAHDASSAVSRWIDYALAAPGRSVCVAAGNAGQEAPTHDGDIGFVLGRIHTSGRIPAAGLDTDIEWIVVGNGRADLSENEIEIWYSAADRFAVSLRPPGATRWIGPIEPGQFIENRQLADKTFLSIYNELYHEANGSNYIGIYLSPFLTTGGVVGVGAGSWTVRLHGREVRDGGYHGWIERDDPRRIGRLGTRELWRFPSFFSARSNVDSSSVSSLACGQRVISVANLDGSAERIHPSSSEGPTRDGRSKPEVAAPGTDVLAANGFDPRAPWVAKTGTSMASPYVAGVVGLMLAVDPTLTAAQVGGIIKRTARPLPGADFTWRKDSGYGEIDPAACVREAAGANRSRDFTE